MPKRTLCFSLWSLAILLAGLSGCGGGRSTATAPPVTTPPRVDPSQAPTIQFTAQPPSIFLGQSSTLSWTTANATTVTIQGLGTVATSGSQVVSPATTQTYTATATGSGGSAQATVTVTVAATASPIQHVVVLILQNSSFDHLFGVFQPANGTIEGLRPGVPGYTQTDASGKSISPFLLTNTAPPAFPEGRKAYLADIDNGAMDKFAFTEGDTAMGYYDSSVHGIQTLWSYARQFALADHFFQSVVSEAPTNQLYMVAAADNNFPFSVQPFFGPCNQADPAAQPYSFPHVGDELQAHNVSWTMFQEGYSVCTSSDPLHNAFQYFVDTNNTPRIQDYSQFTVQLNSGTLPAVSFVVPANNHDMHPGDGPISGGINFVSNLVTQIQSSTIWPNTAILIVFDDAGGWYDHVPPPTLDAQGLGERVPFLALSPFAKPGYISHVVMDDVSILRFIQWNWGLPSLNPRNQQSGDVFDMFQFPPHP